MRQLICFIYFFGSVNSFAQINARSNSNLELKDSCDYLKLEASIHYLGQKMHSQPLYVANNVIIMIEELDTVSNLIEDVSMFKCLESFKRYDYPGINGVIIIKTKQIFEVGTPVSICKDSLINIQGKVLYALNGFILRDPNLLISKKAVREIESFLRSNGEIIINIWTLSRDERIATSAVYHGLRVTQ